MLKFLRRSPDKDLKLENVALRNKVDFLREQLDRELKKNALLDDSPLPKCKSLACASCKHIVYQDTGARVFILGCGKDKNWKCDDYEKSDGVSDKRVWNQVLREVD